MLDAGVLQVESGAPGLIVEHGDREEWSFSRSATCAGTVSNLNKLTCCGCKSPFLNDAIKERFEVQSANCQAVIVYEAGIPSLQAFLPNHIR